MAKTNGNGLVVFLVLLLLIAMMSGARSVTICDVDTDKLSECRPAVAVKSPSRPTWKCCRLVRRANLPCLCNFKSALPSFGINPARAMTLPKKCGIKTPPECRLA